MILPIKTKPLILTEEIPVPGAKTKTTEKSPEAGRSVYLAVRVVPGAARTAAVGMLGDAIKIRVAAAPEDGAANKALCTWLKRSLGALDVQLASGASSRNKLLRLEFAGDAPSPEEIWAQLLFS